MNKLKEKNIALDREAIKVAYYYYKQQYSQQEIAEKFNFSRQKVNRLLKKANEEGIIEIKINGVENFNIKLEDEIEKTFNLKEVIVVENKQENQLFIEAAKYIELKIDNYIRKNNKCNIGVTWGETLNKLTNYINYQNNNISVTQLVGGINTKDIFINPQQITNNLAMKLNAQGYNLFAPAIIENINAKEILMSEINTTQIKSRFNNVNISIVGIGDFSIDSTFIKQGHVNDEDYKRLLSKNAVGDVCLRVFDQDGKIVDEKFNNKVVGIEVEEYKKIDFKIGIAFGERKAKAIIGAIKGNFIDALITDEETASLIIQNNIY
ncbi:MAG: sugar-binding transcriptional regulator [Peptostreptococcaceae bacterium]